MTSKNYLPTLVRHQQSDGSWVFGAAVGERGHLKTGYISHRLGAILIKNSTVEAR